MVIAYLRSLRSSGTDRQEPGDAAAGEEIYWGKGLCDQCHRIQGRGGRLGPDLSNIGRARSRSALTRELRNASEYFPPGYEPVTVVLRDGRRIPGVRKNEDTFSIQWMDAYEELRLLLKSDVAEVIHEKRSLMPDYGPEKFTDAELDDLVSYLRTLGTTAALTGTAKDIAQGIGREDLLAGLDNPQRWLTYSGDYTGQRNSPLARITTENVRSLAPRWTFQTGVLGKFEASPIVVDGVLFVTGQDNHAWALDARTGRTIWHYRKPLPELLNVCCGSVNRGFAIYQGRLYMATLDARLVALDAKTGSLIWDVHIADPGRGYSATAAPLVVKDKVVVGIAGAEYGTRGFLDAYDADTGKRRWRFWTVPEPGQPGGDTWAGDAWQRGGGSTWLTGTYDPELNLLYWGTGNPGPDLLGEVRPGANLYTDSVVALDADTGELRWYYQFTPHDTHDWDANQVPVLADIEGELGTQKLLMLANRNGFFYTLDRTNGELLQAKPYVHTTWAEEIGPDGKPVLLPDNTPSADGTFTCPDVEGATNWMSPSFNPSTGWFYVTAREACATYYAWPQEFIEGQYLFRRYVPAFGPPRL